MPRQCCLPLAPAPGMNAAAPTSLPPTANRGGGSLFARQDVLLDGALKDGDRPTLIRLISEAFGRPTETTVSVEKQEELPLETLVDVWRQPHAEKEAGTAVAQEGDEVQ